MRQGKTPQQACEEAIGRIIKKSPNFKDFQVGYIAVNKKGETGYYAIHDGFWATKYQNDKNENFPSDYYNKV
jgi:N4-(beta-N-acetylglucosaminyl)-L-asparaginase